MTRTDKPSPSLQALLKERQEDHFVGRQTELDSFAEVLAAPPSDRRWFLLNVYGQGGLGKTTLLRRLEQVAASNGAATGWTDHGQIDLLGAMAALAKSMGSHFDDFTKLYSSYEAHRHKLESASSAPEALGRVIGSAVGRGGVVLARRIPLAGGAFDFIDEDVTSAQLADVGAFIARQLKRDEAQLVLNPLPALTGRFIAGLRIHAENGIGPVLFFDTYESTSRFLEDWLTALVGGTYGELPGNILVVVAGRHQLSVNVWAQYEVITRRIELSPFDSDEADELLRRCGVRDATLTTEIKRLAGGLPLLLSTLAVTAGSASGGLRATDTAVDRFLSSEHDPAKRRLILDAALPRTLNEDVVALLESEDTATTFDWLRTLPFVEAASDGWVYHSVVRKPMVHHHLRESPARCHEIHKRLGEYYKERLESAERSWSNSVTRRLDSNETYHYLMSDYSHYLPVALRWFVTLWGIDPEYAEPTAIALEDAEDDLNIERSERWGDRALAAIAAQARRFIKPAIEFLDALLAAHQVMAKGTVRGKVLVLKAELQRIQSDYTSALESLNAAAQVLPDDGEILYLRAFVLQQLGRAADAMHQIEMLRDNGNAADSLLAASNVLEIRVIRQLQGPDAALPLLDALLDEDSHPWAFLTRGEVNRALGNGAAAIADFERAIELRPDYEHEASKEIGITLVEQGDETGAEAAMIRALRATPHCSECWFQLTELYRTRFDGRPDETVSAVRAALGDGVDDETASFRGQAFAFAGFMDAALEEFELGIAANPNASWAYSFRGRIHASSERWTEARADADRALELYPGDSNALRVRGTARGKEGDLAGAVDDVTRAIELDPQLATPSTLNELGLWYARLGQYDSALAWYQRAVDEGDGAPWVYAYNIAVVKTLHDGEESAKRDRERAIAAAAGAPSEGFGEAYIRAGLAAVVHDDDTALEALRELIGRDMEMAMNALTDPAWSELCADGKVQQLFDAP